MLVHCVDCGILATTSWQLNVDTHSTLGVWQCMFYLYQNLQLLIVSFHFQSNGVQHGVYKVVHELILVLLPIPLLLDKTPPTHSKIQHFYSLVSYFHLFKNFNMVHFKLKSWLLVIFTCIFVVSWFVWFLVNIFFQILCIDVFCYPFMLLIWLD
jgi:hypothetical protein